MNILDQQLRGSKVLNAGSVFESNDSMIKLANAYEEEQNEKEIQELGISIKSSKSKKTT